MNNNNLKSLKMAQELYEKGDYYFQSGEYSYAIGCYHEAASKGYVLAKYMLGYSYRCTYSINNSNEWF